MALRLRELLAAGLAALGAACWAAPAPAQEQAASGTAQAGGETVVAARLWPAPDYTRLTLESPRQLKFEVFVLRDPERLVLDLEGLDMGPALDELSGKVTEADPYIKSLRVGRNRPDVVRVVLDLKTAVSTQVFTLKPIAQYGYRLVVDLRPLVAPDPLLALLDSDARRARSGAAPPEGKRPGTRAPRPQVARLATIVIDPGHGGEDPGARGRRGTHEKDVTLMIARRLKALIDREPGMRALLTRDGDYYLSLHERVEKARNVKADLFVSIHADAFIRPHARGSSVFALSERRATSEAAEWLAKKENEADLVGGVNLDVKDPYLKRTLIDLSQTATMGHSLKLGDAVLTELGRVNSLHKRHVEQAGFAVLKAPDVPSILVETAFISNPHEEKKLKSRAYQERLAHALLAGIKRYLDKHPPRPQPTLALN